MPSLWRICQHLFKIKNVSKARETHPWVKVLGPWFESQILQWKEKTDSWKLPSDLHAYTMVFALPLTSDLTRAPWYMHTRCPLSSRAPWYMHFRCPLTSRMHDGYMHTRCPLSTHASWYMHACTPHYMLIVTDKIAQNQSTCTTLCRIYTLVTIMYFFCFGCFGVLLLLLFWDGDSSPSCHGTHSVDEKGLELRVPAASASWVRG